MGVQAPLTPPKGENSPVLEGRLTWVSEQRQLSLPNQVRELLHHPDSVSSLEIYSIQSDRSPAWGSDEMHALELHKHRPILLKSHAQAENRCGIAMFLIIRQTFHSAMEAVMKVNMK